MMKRTRLFFATLALLLLMPLRAGAENVHVDPTEFDYGEVMVGTNMPMLFTITSTGPTPLFVTEVSVVNDENDYFAITAIDTPIPVLLDVDDFTVVEVTFTPGNLGTASASLYVESDAMNDPYLYIPLQGEGVIVDPSPSGLMDYTLAFFNSGVVNGTILGVGRPRAAEKRIDRFEALLDGADEAIDAGDDAGACEALDDAYYRIDGIPRPNDYLVGPAVPTLSTLIVLVMDSLGCP